MSDVEQLNLLRSHLVDLQRKETKRLATRKGAITITAFAKLRSILETIELLDGAIAEETDKERKGKPAP